MSSALPRLRQVAVRFDVIIRGKSPVREQRSLGSVRGAVRADEAKGRPYRDRLLDKDLEQRMHLFRILLDPPLIAM